MTAWRVWVKWNGSMEQTLLDGQHLAAGDATIAAARAAAKKKKLQGILTVDQIADHRMLGRVWVLDASELHDLFGSKTPPKKAIESDHDAFLEKLEAGQSVAITAFLRGQPTAVLFAGQPDLKR